MNRLNFSSLVSQQQFDPVLNSNLYRGSKDVTRLVKIVWVSKSTFSPCIKIHKNTGINSVETKKLCLILQTD